MFYCSLPHAINRFRSKTFSPFSPSQLYPYRAAVLLARSSIKECHLALLRTSSCSKPQRLMSDFTVSFLWSLTCAAGVWSRRKYTTGRVRKSKTIPQKITTSSCLKIKCLPAAWLSLAISHPDLMLYFACLIQDKTAEDGIGKAHRVGIAQILQSHSIFLRCYIRWKTAQSRCTTYYVYKTGLFYQRNDDKSHFNSDIDKGTRVTCLSKSECHAG